MIILPLTYFGPVQYYSKFFFGESPVIEQYDNYNKQSFRNRCVILGANGPIPLVIPVKKNRTEKTLVKDILIDYDTNWRKLHWRGIVSSYSSSPYFEYYRDSIEPFYTKSYNFLSDYCFEITLLILKLINIESYPALTTGYVFAGDVRIDYDFRDVIHPKKDVNVDRTYIPQTYRQVFSERFGFFQNLSIIDLLFNLGPESPGLLKRSLLV